MCICLPLGAQGLQSLLGVLGCHLHQLVRLPLLWDKELHLFAAALRTKPLTDDLCLFNFLWPHPLCRDGGGSCVELAYELTKHFRIRCIFRALQDEVVASDQFATADEENRHTSCSIRPGHSQRIRIKLIGGEHMVWSLGNR